MYNFKTRPVYEKLHDLEVAQELLKQHNIEYKSLDSIVEETRKLADITNQDDMVLKRKIDLLTEEQFNAYLSGDLVI